MFEFSFPEGELGSCAWPAQKSEAPQHS
jgi:hypothetical protein